MSIRSRITKKTAVLLGVPAAAVVAAGIAYAASATVSSTTVGGGTSGVSAGCNVAASYVSGTDTKYLNSTTTPSAATAGYYVVSVTVTPSPSGAASACSNKDWRVTLAKSDGTSLGEATGTFLSTAAAQDVTLSTPALAYDVASIYGVITG